MNATDRTKGRMGKDPRQVVSDVPLAGAAGRNGVVAAGESGVALRLPPQSKIAGGRAEALGLEGWCGDGGVAGTLCDEASQPRR